MNTRATEIRERVAKARRDLEAAEHVLSVLVRDCRHKFSEPFRDDIHTPGYTDPGDPPGTMGVDWRGPCHIPPKTVERWVRVCMECGKREETTVSTEQMTKVPKFH